MQTDQTSNHEDILLKYDQRQDAFELFDVSGELNGIVSQLREASRPIPVTLLAEHTAFTLIPEYSSKTGGWGTYYGPIMEWGNGVSVPDNKSITVEVVEYWISRSRTAKHPNLRTRYADLAWDFSKKLASIKCPHDVPRIMIDSVLETNQKGLFNNEIEGIRQLKRALEISLSMRDESRIEKIRDAIIAYEDKIAVDHLPGLWGFSLELLSEENRKAQITSEQEAKIIAALESRLSRLSGKTDISELDPHHVEHAALLLARYYRRKNQADNVRRVMLVYASAFVRKASKARNLAAAAWLQDVHQTLLSFNLHDEAKQILPYYDEAARKMRESMPTLQTSISIDSDKLEDFYDSMTSGDWQEVFAKLLGYFSVNREQATKELHELRKGSTFLNLFSTTVVDHQGRATARVGSLESDPEGNLVRYYAQKIGLASSFLRECIRRLIDSRQMKLAHITPFLFESPVFDTEKRPIIERALLAYLDSDWLVMVHLTLPQIEDCVRNIVRLTSGDTMRQSRNKDGLNLRMLDDLLQDNQVMHCLGDDTVFYLRALLTDQRGLNIRNDVSHGITQYASFDAVKADRLFLVLLLLGDLRAKVPEESPNKENLEEVQPVLLV